MNNDVIGASIGVLGFGLKGKDYTARRRGAASRVRQANSYPAHRQEGWACYATHEDLASGLVGGTGRILMAAAALNLSFSVRVRDPLDSAEALSPRYGRSALLALALRRRFRSLVISEPTTLGSWPEEIMTTLEQLAGHGIGVFSACEGWLSGSMPVR